MEKLFEDIFNKINNEYPETVPTVSEDEFLESMHKVDFKDTETALDYICDIIGANLRNESMYLILERRFGVLLRNRSSFHLYYKLKQDMFATCLLKIMNKKKTDFEKCCKDLYWHIRFLELVEIIGLVCPEDYFEVYKNYEHKALLLQYSFYIYILQYREYLGERNKIFELISKFSNKYVRPYFRATESFESNVMLNYDKALMIGIGQYQLYSYHMFDSWSFYGFEIKKYKYDDGIIFTNMDPDINYIISAQNKIFKENNFDKDLRIARIGKLLLENGTDLAL